MFTHLLDKPFGDAETAFGGFGKHSTSSIPPTPANSVVGPPRMFERIEFYLVLKFSLQLQVLPNKLNLNQPSAALLPLLQLKEMVYH